ncbi:16S rRNA (guanine(527)-N(7))-methyltransferase RsmG [Rhabdaerophilum sp. SD176]|uniref:16S rRNA (guanine(527)-N(7))-methyltransferase RsmG n=1 Tax=Rhabdaerophilum sp. SD176 TaxID=2983548 RepID=UPI0024E02592|nr:16S rRNA (guanine(527)-N(7))-methyltransferase RsmG [Rhabdaerophilum sp. SD176]
MIGRGDDLAGEAILTKAGIDVSRETRERLEAYVGMLREWQARINLVSPTTLDSLWERHIVDSLQLHALKPRALCWADMGSGGGLPGIVIACALAGRAGAQIHLIESNHKKAAFLRAVSVALELPTTIHAMRIEEAIPRLPAIDVLTARALAQLSDLIAYGNLLLKSGAIGLFPKGRDYQLELTDALRSWQFSYQLHDSITEPASRIIELAFDPLRQPG